MPRGASSRTCVCGPTPTPLYPVSVRDLHPRTGPAFDSAGLRHPEGRSGSTGEERTEKLSL